MSRLRQRQEWKFFGALYRSAPRLAVAWWAILILRGLVPVMFALSMGLLIGAVDDQSSLVGPLVFVGVVFVALQILTPIHQVISSNLGSRCGSWMNDRLMDACVGPPGMAHLERPELINDLTMARDFDLGITGPPLNISMDFIASGLVEMVAGLSASLLLFGFAWWAPLVLIVAWGSTHWLLKESAVWKDRNTEEVRTAQRHADYAFRLAVDAPSAKEVGCSDWPAGSSNDSGLDAPASMSSSGRPPACVSVRWSSASSWFPPPTHSCSGSWRSGRSTAISAWLRSLSSFSRDRSERHRLRWAQLGPRRFGRPCSRRGAAPRCDGSDRRTDRGQRLRGRNAG